MKKDRAIFLPNWFTPERLNAIFTASSITGSPQGGDNRLDLLEELREALQEADANGRTPAQALGGELAFPHAWLRSWSLGCLGAWSAEQTTDRARAILRESCKALKCWGDLKKRLPAVDAADFEADEDFKADLSPADLEGAE